MRKLSAPLLRGCSCLLMTLLLSGCPGGDATSRPSETGDAALAGQSISLNVADVADALPTWDLAIAEWEAATGAECVRTTLDAATPATVEPVVSETPGLLVIPLLSLPDLIQAGLVATVPEDLARGPASPWQELFDGLRRGVAAPQERATNLPLAAPPLLLWYRADLFQQAGLQPPDTWEEYEALVASIGDWGQGTFVAEPWEGDFAATMLLARSASAALHPDNFSFYMDVGSGVPLIDREPFVRTLKRVVELRQSHPDAVQIMSPQACWTALLNGQAAMALTPGPLSSDGDGSTASSGTRPDGVQLAAAILPGSTDVFDHETGEWTSLESGPNRVTVVGPWGYTVCVSESASEELRMASWNLWETIEASERDQGLRGRHWSLCRSSQTGIILPPPGVLQDVEPTLFANAVAASLREPRVVLDIALPERETFTQQLAAAVHRALEGAATPPDALAAAAQAWSTTAQKIGPGHVLNTCRAAMGLSPMPVVDR